MTNLRRRARSGQLSVLSFLMYLVLAVLVGTFVFLVVIPYFTQDNSKASFMGLFAKVNAVAQGPSGSVEPFLLDVSKGGGVVVFNKDVASFQLQMAIPIRKQTVTVAPSAGVAPVSLYYGDWYIDFFRPPECKEFDKPCACYVKKISIKLITGNIAFPNYEQVGCRQWDGDFYLNYEDCDETRDITNECFKPFTAERVDGFVVARHLFIGGVSRKFFEKTPLPLIGGVKLSDYIMNQPQRPVYIEKYGDVVSLGLTSPVLSQSDKKIIDATITLRQKLEKMSGDYYADEPTAYITTLLDDAKEKKKDAVLEFEFQDRTVEITENSVKKQVPVRGVIVRYLNDKLDPKVKEEYNVTFKEMSTVALKDGFPDAASKKSFGDGEKLRLYYKTENDPALTVKYDGDEFTLSSIGTENAFFFGPYMPGAAPGEGGPPEPPFDLVFYYAAKK